MKVSFLGSYRDNFPGDGKKHVVFVGRSNVGKSSLINMIVGSKIAKVSKEPGRTRSVNFFLIDDVYLVDLPGYGFAKVSKGEREEWRRIIVNYFETCRRDIKLVFLLIDGVVGPTDLDMQAIEWIEGFQIPYILVLTKTDRASQREIAQTVKKLREKTQADFIITSSKEGKGKREVMSYILA
ncbi:MAG: YihA family ribosome biogenesis GTP-binding protein [Acidobacteria bacterium]|jgi:GTP-binding protein|nr:MAG: YihA family ribosome biogenesis GTP-binding protein [Acidobacteriota bacterium]